MARRGLRPVPRPPAVTGGPHGGSVRRARLQGAMRFNRLLALALALSAMPATAQPELFFGNGQAPVFREEDLDKRFARSKLNQGLKQGTQDAGCAQVLGAMLTLMGETGVLLHKRDENFMLDPVLVNALNTQLVNQRFPGNAFLVAMVRRVLIDRKLPQEWLVTAQALAPYYPAIDMGRLRFLANGVQPLDSFLVTLPALRERYAQEVQRATSVGASTAEALFRENYLDHEVAFGALELVDVKLEKPKKKRLKKDEEPEAPYMLARLLWVEPEAPTTERFEFNFGKAPKRPRVEITAKLQDTQYTDLNKLLKGSRVLVRGRFWEYKKGLTSIELRDALIFPERDWTKTPSLADPAAVASCPLAVNDLTGLAPMQPGAFGTHR
ncbi:hypothetical protein MXAN_3053 [Myxococcus xanthus DK 1622]|uniref:Uncharacterized protein n=2 Tax=Myxococcaceae TaxID=31 RepID=Q1D7W2_MYXXD|nr:hypothetical protein MXAN_3053 [Myxococcus xanthus DK 1622]NOJ55626.1 hypothetical protein [Myxococcus xanthus]QPM82520.1 hypothetical protein I5Q59_15125 [Myxococcus xanthus]QVW64825.1 hypothetical protein JTM82_20470 [Myxococcus xanthus DZ2]UEO02104.1 hypothetical protein K1515_22325 [Myxococcus xanthus DZ2]